MTLTIILIVVAIGGLVLFGYAMNKRKSVTKDDAMKAGREIRSGMKE